MILEFPEKGHFRKNKSSIQEKLFTKLKVLKSYKQKNLIQEIANQKKKAG